MIDKIIKTKQNELVVIYTHRTPFTIYQGEGDTLSLWTYMNSDTDLTVEQVARAIDSETEDTFVGGKAA